MVGGPPPTRTGWLKIRSRAWLSPTLPHFGPTGRLTRRFGTSTHGSVGWVDIMKEGMAPQAAAEKAFKRIEEIFCEIPDRPILIEKLP